MARPTTRVLALLELLQTHRQISGTELAQRLEVDVRTLRRYVATLEELGIPITTQRGRFGGYSLVPGFRVPPLMFTQDETLAVALGLLAARRLGMEQAAPAIEGAHAKLERVMPPALRKRLRALAEHATLTQPAEPSTHARAQPAGRDADLVALALAIQSQQRVRMVYSDDAGAASTRDIDPYGLVFRRGHWYVSGHCHLRNGLRSFRLDRLRDVTPLPHSFLRPGDFDAAAHLDHSIATLPRPIALRVLLHTDAAQAVAELGTQIGLLLPHDEGILLEARTESLTWFARQLARLPFAFTVLEPASLREAVRAHAQGLLRNVTDADATPPTTPTRRSRPSRA
ncbi:MAG: YafY family protein [Moraxellaceae bacterium]|nr:YafY family protein [Moraxellaceae bacterium]